MFIDSLTPEKCSAQTGLTRLQFLYVFNTYCGLGTEIPTQQALYWLFCYFKSYPIKRAAFNYTTSIWGRSIDVLKKRAAYLASAVNEIAPLWRDRNSLANRIPHHFANGVIGSIDSFPIRICRPKDSLWQRANYNGKFKTHTVKVQCVTNHAGSIIWYSGPHAGVRNDYELLTSHTPPLGEGEKLLGDKGYCGESMSHLIITPIKNKKGHALTQEAIEFNITHSRYGTTTERSCCSYCEYGACCVLCSRCAMCACHSLFRRCRVTVEHSFAFLKRFRILSGVYRGRLRSDETLLHDALNIIIHVCSYRTKMSPHRRWAPINEEYIQVNVPEVTHRDMRGVAGRGRRGRRGRSSSFGAAPRASSSSDRAHRNRRRSVNSENIDNVDESENSSSTINRHSSTSTRSNNMQDDEVFNSGNIFSSFQVDDVVRVWNPQKRSFFGGLIVGADVRDQSFLVHFLNEDLELENVHPHYMEHSI